MSAHAIEIALNREVVGVESKYLLFGASVIGGCFALVGMHAATFEQIAPFLGVVAGHFFGRRSSNSGGGRKGDQ